VVLDTSGLVDVPVQYFQSVIAIELAVAGALLWQIRFFESGNEARRASERLPDSRLRLGLALVLGATVFGSLWAMADEGPKWAAVAVTIGLAVSLIPLLLRVLPPLAKDAKTHERDPNHAVTVFGLVLYVVVVAGFLVLWTSAEGAPSSANVVSRRSRDSAGRAAVKLGDVGIGACAARSDDGLDVGRGARRPPS
jgi:heme/copper-type cytochrome/quinol oxidase subunit 4